MGDNIPFKFIMETDNPNIGKSMLSKALFKNLTETMNVIGFDIYKKGTIIKYQYIIIDLNFNHTHNQIISLVREYKLSKLV